MTTSQRETILRYIRAHGSITPKDAMGFGCYRLAARVHELRGMGHTIDADTSEGFARYTVRVTEADLEAAGQTALWA